MISASETTGSGGESGYTETTGLHTNDFADARTPGHCKAKTFLDKVADTNAPRWHRLLLRGQRILPLG